MSGAIFKFPTRTSANGSLTDYHGDVIVDKADPSGREVLKFWSDGRYMSMTEMLADAKRSSEEGEQ
jgi:hypothetical protein